MNPHCSIFIATSLDGFIARSDGSIDWLDKANASVPAGEDCGFGAFMAAVDVVIIGRKTYEKVLSFGGWAYGEKPVWVLSRTLTELAPSVPATAELLSLAPADVVARAKERHYRRLYIDGGTTIQHFLNDGLISEMAITTIPVLLGSGIRLFGKTDHDVQLRHESTVTYPFGFVQSRFTL
jgi:dihydrofolate reductase